MPLIGNVPKPLAKVVLILLGLATAASATDTAIHKKMFGSGIITLIISNEEINDLMKIFKSFGKSGLLIKCVKNEAKGQKGGFLGMSWGTLGATLSGNLLTDKGTIRSGEDRIRAGHDF